MNSGNTKADSKCKNTFSSLNSFQNFDFFHKYIKNISKCEEKVVTHLVFQLLMPIDIDEIEKSYMIIK